MKIPIILLSFLLSVFLWSCGPNGSNEIDLSGEWGFRIDSLDKGTGQKWFNNSFEETIELPGSMASNGKGNDITVNTHWTGSIFDRSWYTDEKYAQYRKPGNIKVPFWLQPVKKYYGAAWYQKDVDIPEQWSGKRISLFLERCHWETKVWVDGKYAGMQNSLGAPHEYDLTSLLLPGTHKISILVDNRVKDVNPGVNSHSITDHTQTNWNGIAGEIKLIAQPRTSITDVRLFPDVKSKTVKALITIINTGKSGRKATLMISAKSKNPEGTGLPPLKKEIKLAAGTKEYDIVYPMGHDVLLWDEFNPNLYVMNTELMTVDGICSKETQFGMRSFRVAGTRFEVNGRPVFLRGTLECAAFPETGYPATDKKEWTRILKTIKEHGLNHVRFHSWCPPEAAFIAADELGIYLQVECSSWANQGSSIGDGKPIDEWLYKEGEAIVRNFGNHPSFCMMAYGNEPAGNQQSKYLTAFLEYWRSKDNRRVYTGAAGWPLIEENEFHDNASPRIQGWGAGLKSIINAKPPQTTYDWRNKISEWHKPFVSHEIGQWCVYPDFKEIKEYTGVLRAKNFEIFQTSLDENQMGALADSFLLASGKLQALCYKADIEAALRTPGFAGFQLLGLSDFPGQGTALVGILNVFWKEKGYISPDEFKHFCNTTVPLARMSKRIFTNDEKFIAGIEVSSFEKEPLQNVKTDWKIVDKDGNEMWSGTLPQTNLETNNCQELGTISVPLSKIHKAGKFTLKVSVGDFTNKWDFWVYPENKPDVSGQNIKVVQKLDKKTTDFLLAGGRVILTPVKGSLKDEFGGDIGIGFSSIFWNTAWTGGQKPHTLGILCDPRHPALAGFPTEYHSNWQWWDAMSHSNAIVMDSFDPALKPIVRVIDDWFKNHRLALIFEVKAGKGKLIVSGVDLLTNKESRPEAEQLLYSLKKYAASGKFNPQISLPVDKIKEMFN